MARNVWWRPRWASRVLGAGAILPFGYLAMGAGQTPPPSDPVARLQREIAESRRELAYDARFGYLPALLQALNIDPRSQTLVFSKTSLQSSYITRENPRALYFSQDVYVGYIPGAPLIEIMAIDPVRGARFYTLPNVAVRDRPQFGASDDCVRCHGGADNRTAPLLFARSVYTAPSGYPRIDSPQPLVLPSTPFADRWGGWLVTGKHGAARHMGNEFAEGDDTDFRIDRERGANITDLRRFIDPVKYLRPDSDIAVLLTMEQQMHVQNVLSRVARAAHLSGRGIAPEVTESLADALLGRDEAPLPHPITSSGSFAKAYESRFPRDAQGRSVGEYDLQTRLAKYPCSPLIYSPTFAQLPAAVRNSTLRAIESRLASDMALPHVPKANRQALHEILTQTLPGYLVTRDKAF